MSRRVKDRLSLYEVRRFLHNAQVAAADAVQTERVPLLALYAREVRDALEEDIKDGFLSADELIFSLISAAYSLFEEYRIKKGI